MKKTIINLTIAGLAFWLAYIVHTRSVRTLVTGFRLRQVEQAEHCLQRAVAAYDAGVMNGVTMRAVDDYHKNRSNYFLTYGLGDSTNVVHHEP